MSVSYSLLSGRARGDDEARLLSVKLERIVTAMKRVARASIAEVTCEF